MSTQISITIDQSCQTMLRVLQLIDKNSLKDQIKSYNSSNISILEKTFEESAIKTKHQNLSQLSSKIQSSLKEYLYRQNAQILKYEQNLQELQQKIRNHVKKQLEFRILIQNLQDQNIQIQKQICLLKQDNINLQKILNGTQRQMKTQINTLKTQIQQFKRLDKLISSKLNRQDQNFNQNSYQKTQQSSKCNTVRMIKNRLSILQVNDLSIAHNRHVQQRVQKQQNNKLYDQNQKKKTKLNSSTKSISSRRSSVESLKQFKRKKTQFRGLSKVNVQKMSKKNRNENTNEEKVINHQKINSKSQKNKRNYKKGPKKPVLQPY